MKDSSVTWPTFDEPRVATGSHHNVGKGQLFFSMTDRRGIITAANSVFVQLARFSRDELMGSPHSIIRHPEMPAGCFKLMWDEILAGRPFCCYINNLARDGSTYTVFATITPAADDFLSVRVAPLRGDLLSQSMDLYATALLVEQAARKRGTNRRGTAAIGADKLQELVSEAGFESYDDFQWLALVAEADARAQIPAGLETRPQASGPTAAMLICCHTLADELRHWSGRQADIAHMARSLTETIPHLINAAGCASATVNALQAAHAAAGEKSGTIVFLTSRIDQMSSLLKELVDNLIVLRQSCRDTRCWVALAEIHTDAVSQFAVEILDQGLKDYDRVAIQQLCQALDYDFTQVSELSEQNAGHAAAVAHELERAAGMIRDRRSLIDKVAAELAAEPDTAHVMAQISQEFDAVDAALGLIQHLGEAARAIATPQDTALAESQVARLLEQMATVATA